ncbi:DUF5677 domain-containing protein [Fluviicola chungangensis]|uniref:Uncharacterized protein n=1 Tax=Fluviicola chungangensis TaxID=2597671 RepID=A0A556N2T0_9FLAO|nr:DUF5677 domain-containing protein [Fluviicola chungangensis]TSJ46383.1 hypothetical protein FO442_04290 [Fluviicola chungangensis]
MNSTENAVRISESSRNIPVEFKIQFSHNLYTKMLLNCMSILKLCPNDKSGFLDFFSIATLTRALMENFAVYHYMSSKTNDPEEDDFKLKMAIFHWDCEKFALYKELKFCNEDLKEFEEVLPKRASDLETHPYFSKVHKDKRKKILKGQVSMLKSHFEILREIDFGSAPITAMYRFYSNYTHSTAFSIMTMRNERGMGDQNEAEIGYTCFALEFADLILRKGVNKLIDLLPELVSKADSEVIKYFRS